MTDREQFLRFWSAHVDALERHLDRKAEGPERRNAGEGPAAPRQRSRLWVGVGWINQH